MRTCMFDFVKNWNDETLLEEVESPTIDALYKTSITSSRDNSSSLPIIV
jgi:hypothetical protein